MSAHRFVSQRRARRLVSLSLALFPLVGCGSIGCPEAFAEIDGVCVKLNDDHEREGAPQPMPSQPTPERCDGLDNDLDDQIDEPWPELGQPCGPSKGECVPGVYVCTADGASIECDGVVGPSVEVCDGLDNDCDGIDDNGAPEVCNGEDDDCNGLIDDGVLSIKQESFDEHTTVAATEAGFVLTRVLPNDLRVETYDSQGNSTGHFDDFVRPYPFIEFIESSASGERVLAGYGKHQFHVLEAVVDDQGVPLILDVARLHHEWDQGIDLGVFTPPLHPRLSAFPARFIGYTNLVTFAVTPFEDAPGSDLTVAPMVTEIVPFNSVFDVAGPYVAWEDGDNVRAGWLLDDATFAQAMDVGRGTKPAIAVRDGGPSVAFLQDSRLRITELSAFSFQCVPGRFCDAPVATDPIEEARTTAIDLAYVQATGTWLIAVDDQILVVGRVDGEARVQQAWSSLVAGLSPTRIDVESTGSTAAIVQSSSEGDSVLTFVGCL